MYNLLDILTRYIYLFRYIYIEIKISCIRSRAICTFAVAYCDQIMYACMYDNNNYNDIPFCQPIVCVFRRDSALPLAVTMTAFGPVSLVLHRSRRWLQCCSCYYYNTALKYNCSYMLLSYWYKVWLLCLRAHSRTYRTCTVYTHTHTHTHAHTRQILYDVPTAAAVPALIIYAYFVLIFMYISIREQRVCGRASERVQEKKCVWLICRTRASNCSGRSVVGRVWCAARWMCGQSEWARAGRRRPVREEKKWK